MTDVIELAAGRARKTLEVASASARPIRISSHYPFWLVNHRLKFAREEAHGFRLDIPSGTSVAWAPGESKTVQLVAFATSSGVDS